MRLPRTLVFAAAFALPFCAAAVAIYDYPAFHARHKVLRANLERCAAAGDWRGMASVCRSGKAMNPDDPFWRYNLACALSRLGSSDAALAELLAAAERGFPNVAAMAADADFAPIKGDPRFAKAVAAALKAANNPPESLPVAKETLSVAAGGKACPGPRNFTWDFNAGVFFASVCATNAPASDAHYRGPAAAVVSQWLADGSAAGLSGDFYMNRDRGHSVLDVSKFPLLSVFSLDSAAAKRGLDMSVPLVAPRAPLFTNCSRGVFEDGFKHSIARLSVSDALSASAMETLYLSNQIHVFPALDDFKDGADNFHMAAPYYFATRGASWTDRPLLELLLAATAALRPDTKKEIVSKGLLAPTLQALLRRSVKGAPSPLSPQANPSAFEASKIDALALVSAAHEMAPEAIPPLAAVSFREIRAGGSPAPEPQRDYPDIYPETVARTRFASCFAMRALDGERVFELHASAIAHRKARKIEFAWVLMRGDPRNVSLETPDGPSAPHAVIAIDRKTLDSRVDVACFARTEASGWSAPSFVSFLPIPGESRVYRDDGRISSIDYRGIDGRCGWRIALPRAWRDLYLYDADGGSRGFARIEGDGISERTLFSSPAVAVKEPGPDGGPAGETPVKYLMRETGGEKKRRDLVWAEDETGTGD